jgi:molybdenum cofactor cytidylyltransferase
MRPRAEADDSLVFCDRFFMTRVSSLCGLILAAGESSRMGTDKALLPWPPVPPGTVASFGHTLLSAAISALKPFTEAVLVVAGKNTDNLAAVVSANGASLVRNPAPERGQFSSLQVGLREVLDRGYDAAMIVPVDCPPLCRATLELLRAAFDRALSVGKWAVAPENNGKHGHPLLAGRALIEAFLLAPSTSNARAVKRTCAQAIEYVPVPDALVREDMNTPEEYAALAAPGSSQLH